MSVPIETVWRVKLLINKPLEVSSLINAINMENPGKNLDNLCKKLRADIEADRMYWIRNDAKLKAVVTSKSYDEFRWIEVKPLNVYTKVCNCYND